MLLDRVLLSEPHRLIPDLKRWERKNAAQVDRVVVVPDEIGRGATMLLYGESRR